MSCKSSDPPSYCSNASSPELNLYQAMIFSVPVFFTFVVLFVFYLFYLRRRRANWQSLRMRAGGLEIPRASESGIKKEIREMLPVVVFKESFLIRETQCAVCLADYRADDRLQKIPSCGHTFHVECIDLWLATNTTCPLCRISLLPAARATSSSRNNDFVSQEDNMEERSSERPADIQNDNNDYATAGRSLYSVEDYSCAIEVEDRQENEGFVVINTERRGDEETNSRT